MLASKVMECLAVIQKLQNRGSVYSCARKIVPKSGARVMFVFNNFDLGFVNGAMGWSICLIGWMPVINWLMEKNNVA